MKKILEKIFTRFAFVVVAIILQIAWVVVAMYYLSSYSKVINILFFILSIILICRMMFKWENNPAYVLAWSVPILAFPVFGLTIYFLFGRASLTRKNRRYFTSIHEYYSQYMMEDSEIEEEINQMDLSVGRQTKYTTEQSGYPIWKNTMSKYYPVGELMFEDMITELKKAEHFIFMEFFIVCEGYMWNTILEILEDKVKQGVDVRFIYDDVGSIHYLPTQYYKDLQAKGIKCAAFNPFRPVMSIVMNNRNHRKIMVIDGHTAFTGGVNLADEYINKIVRFGYWKDTGVMLKGDAVWNFTVMFIEMWHYICDIETSTEELMKLRPDVHCKETFETDGYIQPYADSPYNKEYVGENIYRNIISRAKNYVYIYTPYLIIGNEMATTLCLAAKSGVDVRIVTPEIPDKPLIFLLTQSYYARLIKNGVKIYQYTPGFIHAKTFIADDEIATVGSMNLDFRSLYLHFECGCWMYKNQAIKDVKADFLDTFDKSHEITLDFCMSRPLPVRAAQAVLRLFAPLL